VSVVLIERFLCVSVLTGAFRESRRRRRMLNEKHRPDKWPLGKSRLRAFAIQKLLAAICCVGSYTVFLSFSPLRTCFLLSSHRSSARRPAARSLAGRRCSLSYKCSAVDFTPPKCIHKVVRMAIKRATAAHVLCTPPISDDDDAPRLLHIKTRINERPPFKLGVEWKRSRDRVGAENMAK